MSSFLVKGRRAAFASKPWTQSKTGLNNKCIFLLPSRGGWRYVSSTVGYVNVQLRQHGFYFFLLFCSAVLRRWGFSSSFCPHCLIVGGPGITCRWQHLYRNKGKFLFMNISIFLRAKILFQKPPEQPPLPATCFFGRNSVISLFLNQ